MNRKATYKFYVKTKLDRENDAHDIYVRTKGDYFEALMFAVEAVTASCMDNLKMNKKGFLQLMGSVYDSIKEETKDGE